MASQSLQDSVRRLRPYYSDGDVGGLYCGDAAAVLPELPASPQLVVTSPPYDHIRNYGGHGFDFEGIADALVAVLPVGGVLVWVVADGVIDGSKSGTSFRQALGFMGRGLRLHDTMIYEKAYPTNPTPQRYGQVAEFMFVFSNGKPAVANLIKDRPNTEPGRFRLTKHPTGRAQDGTHAGRYVAGGYTRDQYGRRNNIWRYKVGYHHQAPDFLAAHEHPAIYPYALARDHILTWTNPGDLVLDPMMGSGTTLRAAKDVGRRYVGVDIHEPYCELAKRRLAQQVLTLT